MRLNISCVHCTLESIGDKENNDQFFFEIDSLNDSNLYKYICPREHRVNIYIQEPKYHILFMIGENAILDGYLREAVSSFASCAESSYKEYFYFISYKNGIDRKLIDNNWNHLSRQSERQFGAFISAWTLEKKTAPILLKKHNIELRNRVIHKGYIPTKQEAIDYGENVINVVGQIYSEIKCNSKYDSYVKEYYNHKKIISDDFPNLQIVHLSNGIKKQINESEDFTKHLESLRLSRLLTNTAL